MYPDCQPSKQEMVHDSMESVQDFVRFSGWGKSEVLCNIRIIWTTWLVYICCWDFSEQSSWMPRLWRRLYQLSGSRLLFTEQLKHLEPWEARQPSVNPVLTYRQQITEGKGRNKIVLHVTLQMSGQRTKKTNPDPDAWGKKFPSPFLERNKSHPCIKVHCLSICFCMFSKTIGQL